ncbi:histidine kinase [uncultured Croceitalea sp.]|uniref:sensor histidine kinase n=1 Tax=uncultured Croceitalea sp. TaxID=1798908 RepID=UPI003305C0C7
MDKKWFLGLKRKEVLAFVLFYFFFATLYYVTLWINQGGLNNTDEAFFSFVKYLDMCGLQYSVFLLFTLPIWYLIFRQFQSKKLYLRLLLHFITLPIFVFGTQKTYYWLSDLAGFYHLEGRAAIWDVYIPALFYLLQFGIFHAYEHYKENQRKLILEGELRQAALKSELAAIKAQLNPHFLYNVFNTINASVPAENERTRNMIAQLSDLFRYQLRASKTDIVTLEEELEFVKKYLDLEKERFKERLHIDIKVSKDLMSEKIPPMLLQPLVENSVKHGLASLIEGGTISIYIFKEEGKLKFEISDTGVGIKNKQNVFDKGVGLTNTRLRLQKMYQSQLELLDNSPKGLTIKFAI